MIGRRLGLGPWVVATVCMGSLTLLGCDGCGNGAESPGSADGAQLQLGPLPEEVPVPGAIYQDAYDRALEEITADNARDRLREIERSVARERRELP